MFRVARALGFCPAAWLTLVALGFSQALAQQAEYPSRVAESAGQPHRAGEPLRDANVRPAAAVAPADGWISGDNVQPIKPPSYSPRYAKVTSGTDTLPNSHGQVWREYDISPYTLREASTARPEMSLIDWVLRETGYETWHSEVVSVLSADGRTLRVYHTPEVQATVARVVDRFLAGGAESRRFNFRAITLDDPTWRALARWTLRRVETQTPGTAAWVMDREDAVMLLAKLRRRADYRELNSPHQMVSSGRSAIISSTRARNYIQRATPREDVWPGFVLETGTIDEGYTLEFSPLLSVDRDEVDLVLTLQVDLVERFVPVVLDIPTTVGGVQRAKIEVPQTSHLHYQERFRWPVDSVLLIDLGVVPMPESERKASLLPTFSMPLTGGNSSSRANVLVLVESRSAGGAGPVTALDAAGSTFNGRY